MRGYGALWLLLLTFCCSTCGAQNAAAPVMNLGSPWTLQTSDGLAQTGEQISQPTYAATAWMPAVVPGTVLTSYVKAGRYPEPYFDLNNKLSSGLIPDASVAGSVFTHPHWYRTAFTLNRSFFGRTIWLDFGGINYRASIFLNGKPIGEMRGMFKRGMFDVTESAVIGRNALAVEIFPLDVPGTPHDSGCGGDGKIGQNAATMYATIGWDFTIVDGIRDRNMGIYRDVRVVGAGPVRVVDPWMMTESIPVVGGADSARLRFKTTLVNASAVAVTGELRAAIGAPDSGPKSAIPAITQTVTLQPHETREIELLPVDHPGLVVAHPRIWWPVPQGKPVLYPLTVSFATADGVKSDAVATHFGIRTITRDTSFHGQNTFWVNGRRTFIQGGNWVQDAMLRSTPESYAAQIRPLADAGVNMLRCWSASAPESDAFFDECDRDGIMTWVESGAAAQVNGPSDVQLQLDNWTDTVRRVRGHPCVAYYCGGNEGWPVRGTQEVAAAVDPSRGYQNSSQENGQRGCPYRYIGVDTLYDYTAKDLFGSGPLGPFGGFCNETGTVTLPPTEVLRGMVAEQNLWPTANNPGFAAAINYHDGGGFHQMRRFIDAGCASFGEFDAPDLAGRVGVDNYAFKGQILGAMTFRAMSEVWKRNQWDEAHGRFDTGYMLWTVNSANPMAAGRLVNYTGEPNAALFYYAHGNKPVHAQFDYFASDITVVNDTAAALPNLRVRVEVRNLDGSVKWSAEKTVDGAASQSTTGVVAVPAKDTAGFDAVHFIAVKLYDAAGKLVDDALYWRSADGPKYGADGSFEALNDMPFARLRVRTTAKVMDGRQIVTATLTNPTTALAFFTRLKIYRAASQTLVQPCRYTDNYFSIEPGGATTVNVDYPIAALNGEKPQLVVEGWNLKSIEITPGETGETPAGSVTTHTAVPRTRLLSLRRSVTVSSTEEGTGNVAGNAVDGDLNTRWASKIGVDPQWITVDLGVVQPIESVRIDWEAAAAKDYQIQVYDDSAWTTVKTVTGNAASGMVTFPNLGTHGRYVRIYCTARATPWGYSLYEIQVR